MDMHVDLSTALATLRQEEIRREIAALHLARQARIAGARPWGVGASVLRFWATLSQALLSRTALPPAR